MEPCSGNRGKGPCASGGYFSEGSCKPTSYLYLPVPPPLSATTTFFPLRAVASISHSVHARIHDCPPRTMYSLTPRTHARPHESSRNHTLLAKQSLITLAFSALPYDSEASYATFTLYGTFYSAASPRPTNIRQDYTWDGTA